MGRACAKALSAQGTNIVGVHFDVAERQPEIDDLVAQLQQNDVDVRFFNANAASDNARAETIAAIADDVRAAGGFRILIHSLAFGSLVPYLADEPGQDTLTRRQMEMTLSVMAHSLVYWVQDLFAQKLLSSNGHVFAMTSAGSSKVTKTYGAVSAAKCALESHVRQLALELAPYSIAVNSIRAGVTLTPSLQRIPEHEELAERARHYNPHGRLTTPEDVADAIVLLSQAASSWITGNIIGVDGGEILTT
jgi:NAD(P)-dependent dehydrogenase (short-subunit alcohol dehydrogenase family)